MIETSEAVSLDPLVDSGFYTENEAQVKRGVAQHRLAALRGLDVSQPKRDELAASGVGSARIDALYPFDFGDYIEGIIPLISNEKLYSITSMDSTRHLLRDVETLSGFTLPRGKDLLRQQNTGDFGDKMAQLASAITRCLPMQNTAPVEASKLLAIVLWQSMTFTAHPELVESPLQAYKLFKDITYLLLPHLHAQENDLIAQMAQV